MWDILPRQGTYDVTRSKRARRVVPGVGVRVAHLVALYDHRPRRDGIDRRQKPQVDVGRPGVARVAAGADDVAAAYALSDGEAHRARTQVTQLGVLARRVLDDDEVALVASFDVGRRVVCARDGAHDGAVGGREHGAPEAGEAAEGCAARWR